MSLSPADVKVELGFSGDAVGLGDTDFDALIADLIARESERVEDAIEIQLGETTGTDTLSRPSHVAGPYLPLPERPVHSVASVTIDTDRVAGGDVAASDYRVTNQAALELLPEADRARWPTERRSITVEWSYGYPMDDTPDVVNAAIIGLVRQALQEIDADGISQESIADQSVNYELPDAVVARHLNRAKRFDEPDFYTGANVI